MEQTEVVRKFAELNPNYVRALKEDGDMVASLLLGGMRTTVRQFACEGCKKTWWRKVPDRKEVSKCFGCNIWYDPIPKDMEWGLGAFSCDCGHIFIGFAQTGVTSSECYNCG